MEVLGDVKRLSQESNFIDKQSSVSLFAFLVVEDPAPREARRHGYIMGRARERGPENGRHPAHLSAME